MERSAGGSPIGRRRSSLPGATGGAHTDLGIWAQGMSSVHDVREAPMAYFMDEKVVGKNAPGREDEEYLGLPMEKDEMEIVDANSKGKEDSAELGKGKSKKGSKRGIRLLKKK